MWHNPKKHVDISEIWYKFQQECFGNCKSACVPHKLTFVIVWLLDDQTLQAES